MEDAFELIEEMSANIYQWPSERTKSRKSVAGVHELDAITALTAQVSALTKRLDACGMGTSGINAIQSSFISCEECGGGHATDSCPGNQESVQFVANYNRQRNDPYSNVYNPGWRNHPNFSWKQNQDQVSQLKPTFPPGFQSQP